MIKPWIRSHLAAYLHAIHEAQEQWPMLKLRADEQVADIAMIISMNDERRNNSILIAYPAGVTQEIYTNILHSTLKSDCEPYHCNMVHWNWLRSITDGVQQQPSAMIWVYVNSIEGYIRLQHCEQRDPLSPQQMTLYEWIESTVA